MPSQVQDSRARPTRTIGGTRGARQPDDRMFQSIPLACSQTRLYGPRSRCDRTSHEPEGFFRLKSAKLLLQLIAVAGAPHHHALAFKYERFQGSAKDELVSGPTNGLKSGPVDLCQTIRGLTANTACDFISGVGHAHSEKRTSFLCCCLNQNKRTSTSPSSIYISEYISIKFSNASN